MRTPGVEVRPLKSFAGHSRFCEVFYDDVLIPLSNVVGEIDKGWAVTLATLGFERGTAAMANQIEVSAILEEMIRRARALPAADGRRRAIDDDLVASRLAVARAEVSALRAMTYATVSRAMHQRVPGPEGSMMRLYHTELLQRVMRLGFDLLNERALDRTSHNDWIYNYLEAFSKTIAGGTSEIQRNIIGERVLELPRA
jgi:alkylation response protein AidB-like acyl-CoA dehydrogenase